MCRNIVNRPDLTFLERIDHNKECTFLKPKRRQIFPQLWKSKIEKRSGVMEAGQDIEGQGHTFFVSCFYGIETLLSRAACLKAQKMARNDECAMLYLYVLPCLHDS